MTKWLWAVGAIAAGALLLALLLRERGEPTGDASSVMMRGSDAADRPELPDGEAMLPAVAAKPVAPMEHAGAAAESDDADAVFVVRHADGVPTRGYVLVLVADE